MLINELFFVGELHIEGLITSNGVPSLTQSAILNEVLDLANRYEYDFYKKIIGIENAKLFLAYLKTSNPDNEGDNKKWFDLSNVLVEEVGDHKESPIAYYIYFYYLKKNQTHSTPLGETVSNSTNTVVTSDIKEVDIWNQMAYLNKYLSDWLHMKRDVYGGYFFDHRLLSPLNYLGI